MRPPAANAPPAPATARSWHPWVWVTSYAPHLVTPAGCWGYLCLHRADSPHGFTPAEVRLIRRLAAHLANGCRPGLTVASREGLADAAPGLVVLHPDLTVAALTDEAEHRMAHIADHRPDPGRLPTALYAVAARLRSLDHASAPPDAAPTVRVRTTTGGWLLIHASHLHGSVGDIAVIIEPAHPSNLAPLLLSSRGLTPREREVALLVLRGASTQAIAADLHLSAYTVKDHLKAIFDKLGVRSRRDLVAHVLLDQQTARSPTPLQE